MNYKKIYDAIILKAKLENRLKNINEYFENHHIIPKSCGGDETKNNKVLLTAKEHYICHYLLIKLFDKKTIERRNMVFAFRTFFLLNNDLMHRYCCARDYESIKIEYKSLMQEMHKNWTKSISKEEYDKWRLKISIGIKKRIFLNGHWWINKKHLRNSKLKIGYASSIHQKGNGNSQYGKKWFTNYDNGESHSFFEKPNNKWILGRNLFHGECKKIKFFIKNEIINDLHKSNSIKKSQELWNKFHLGNYYKLEDMANELRYK